MEPTMNKEEALRRVNIACDSVALDRLNRRMLDEAIAFLAGLVPPEEKKDA